jgi:hypothetical protein
MNSLYPIDPFESPTVKDADDKPVCYLEAQPSWGEGEFVASYPDPWYEPEAPERSPLPPSTPKEQIIHYNPDLLCYK